jgi:hypothetical protein
MLPNAIAIILPSAVVVLFFLRSSYPNELTTVFLPFRLCGRVGQLSGYAKGRARCESTPSRKAIPESGGIIKRPTAECLP